MPSQDTETLSEKVISLNVKQTQRRPQKVNNS